MAGIGFSGVGWGWFGCIGMGVGCVGCTSTGLIGGVGWGCLIGGVG